jgi:hypothetical protein
MATVSAEELLLREEDFSTTNRVVEVAREKLNVDGSSTDGCLAMLSVLVIGLTTFAFALNHLV